MIDSTRLPASPSPSSSTPTSRGAPPWLGYAAVGFGALLWLASYLGLDPTNIPQLLDFRDFHFPSILTFAQQPLATAIADYPAAPFPLFYIVGGWIYRATASQAALHVWSMSVALCLLTLAFAAARERRDARAGEALWVAAIVLVSPYFRGQSVYANTDILALSFAVAAIYVFGPETPSFPSRRGVWALVLACFAVYTRQFYLFLPLYVFSRLMPRTPWRARAQAVALCSVLALPVLLLVIQWHGVTPPRFAQHAVAPSLDRSIPTVILLLGFYTVPAAVITLIDHRRALASDLRRPSLQLAIAPFVVLALAVMIGGQPIPEVVGGGIPVHALRRLPLPEAGANGVLALAVLVSGAYLAYLVWQEPRRNAVLVLVALAFFPTGILYQRYFDPLVPLLLALVVSARETRGPSRGRLLVLMAGWELLVASIGAVHYASVFDVAP